ncbi:hypothetical protein FHR32_005345 [Streptosporangium album]|uniref:Uncharacterized protein n=1 Tax=Streptosporangium album TaxID=47479 RepID=A0A7W7RZ95_9ACTN|nr:hypothetical protein [Streptosporangium album]MBB4940968.1 hypothetical protein [Streptosporangium album]
MIAWDEIRGLIDRQDASAVAAAVATWLNRRDFTSRWGAPYEDTDRIVAVLATRPPEWRAELARRLVLRLRTGEDRGVALAPTLLRATGIEAPIHDPLVVGWLETAGRLPAPSEDPLFDLMLPRIFDAQGVGRALQWESGPTAPWLKALCDLAAGDAAKRLILLEGCVRRAGPGRRTFRLDRRHGPLCPGRPVLPDHGGPRRGGGRCSGAGGAVPSAP